MTGTTPRLGVGEITEAQLADLYDRLEQYRRTVAGLQAANQRLRDRAVAAEARVAALDGSAEQSACDHPITRVVANLPRLDLVCRACGSILAEHTGDDHLPDQSWLFACPDPCCQAARLTPCLRRNGTAATISHGDRWDRYNRALRAAMVASDIAADGPS